MRARRNISTGECSTNEATEDGKAFKSLSKPHSVGCCFCALMNKTPDDPYGVYEATNIEQVANVITHLIPTIISVWGMQSMLNEVCNTTTEVIAACIFGLGMITCFGISSLYHLSSLFFKNWTPTFLLLDYSGIFLLIAAAYTPWMVLSLPGSYVGTTICLMVWVLGIFGIVKTIAQIFPNVKQITVYLLMSYLSIFTLYPLSQSGLEPICMILLVAGIGSCGIGFLFFTQDGRVPFAHAIFHTFVGIGMLIHMYAIHVYVMALV
jgi:channel protein (hemolysin III family)